MSIILIYLYLLLGVYLFTIKKSRKYKEIYIFILGFMSFKIITNYRTCSVAYAECKLTGVTNSGGVVVKPSTELSFLSSIVKFTSTTATSTTALSNTTTITIDKQVIKLSANSKISDIKDILEKKLERHWNIGFLMTGDETYGWFDPNSSSNRILFKKPKLGIVTHNLLKKTTRSISEKQYHHHLFKTSNIEYYETSPTPRKISKFPDYEVEIGESGYSHITAHPKSEYYDTMRIVYIKPTRTSNTKSFDFLPPYIFNDDFSKSQSVLYGIGPIWDPRRYQDVYQKYVDKETIDCQKNSSGKQGVYPTATSSPCKTFPINIIDSPSPSPTPSKKLSNEFFGEEGKEFNTLYGSMKDSHNVVPTHSVLGLIKTLSHWKYKGENPDGKFLYNSIAGHKKNSYLRAVTKLQDKDTAGPYPEDTPMKKMGGFLEDCNFRACNISKSTPERKDGNDIYYSKTWFDEDDAKIDSSESKIFIGQGEKPCPTTQRCNNPYVNSKCNIATPSRCPTAFGEPWCTIPKEVWRRKLGYGEDKKRDIIVFDQNIKNKCPGGESLFAPLTLLKDNRKGLYKGKDKEIKMLRKNKSCGIPCIYKGLSKIECEKLGKKFGMLGASAGICHDPPDGSWTKKNKTTCSPGSSIAPTKISWQKCDTLGEKTTCPIYSNNFKEKSNFIERMTYEEEEKHNFKVIASTSPLKIEKCLPRARGIILGNNNNFYQVNYLNENEHCQPKCHVKNENDIPLPPTHTMNVYTGRIECKYGINISGEVECKKKCLLPAKTNNTFKNIPPTCKSQSSNKYSDKVTEINNYLQKTFYENPTDFDNKKDEYGQLCKSYDGIYETPPPPIKISGVNALCADLNELDDGNKCIYMEKIGTNNVYNGVSCKAGVLSVISQTRPTSQKCDITASSHRDMTSFPTPSKGKYFGVKVDETTDNPQLTTPDPGKYVNILCNTPTPTKITKFHGCTLSPVYGNNEQLTEEYVGRGCYKKGQRDLTLQENTTNLLCSPSPRRFFASKCIEELNTPAKSISTVTPNKLTVLKNPFKDDDKFILKDKHPKAATASACPDSVKNKIYEFTNNNGDINPTLAPAVTTTGRTNIKDNCEIQLIKEHDKFDINKDVCKKDNGSKYMEGIPENSEVVKCPVNSEHLGKCDFKCKEDYDLFTDKNVFIGNSNFKAFCYKGKWIPYTKNDNEIVKVSCKEKGCGYLNETLKFPKVELDGIEYDPKDVLVERTSKYRYTR